MHYPIGRVADIKSLKKKKENVNIYQHFYPKRTSVAFIISCIISIFFVFNFLIYLYVTGQSRTNTTNRKYDPRRRSMINYHPNASTDYIYIDIGCFNGETVEYFLYFIPNSTCYSIYTFEPDPLNYELCRRKLSQPKFKNVNVTISKKVVWIKDEKVWFQIERGRKSRIKINMTDTDFGVDVKELDAFDFSSWLYDLVKDRNVKVHIKMSMPGAELLLLEKMILDDTIRLVDKFEIEWANRQDPRFRPMRIYIQLMLDSYGFDNLYHIRLQDLKRIVTNHGKFENVTKYYDWTKIGESDTLGYFIQRDDKPPAQFVRKNKINT